MEYYMLNILLIIALTIIGHDATKNYLAGTERKEESSAEQNSSQEERSGDCGWNIRNRPEKTSSFGLKSYDSRLNNNERGLNSYDRGWGKKHTCIYLAVSLSAGVCLLFLRGGNPLFGSEAVRQHKLIILLLLILPMAAVDIRLKIIPNRFLLITTGIRVCCYLPEFLLKNNSTMSYRLVKYFNIAGGNTKPQYSIIKAVFADLAAALILGTVFYLITIISRYHFGLGDVKLFALMGFYLGIREAVPVIFCSFMVSGLTAVFLLLGREKKIRDSIAFAPCVFIGLFGYSLLTATSAGPG